MNFSWVVVIHEFSIVNGNAIFHPILKSYPIFISYHYLEIVDWVLILSVGLFPGTVSITTKSIGDSELRPICKERKIFYSEYLLFA